MSKPKMDPARRRRIGTCTLLSTLVLSLALPLGSYGLHWLGQDAQAQAQAQGMAGSSIDGGIVGGQNQRSQYWRAVAGGVAGVSTVKGQEADVLVERSGTYWEQFRSGTIARLLPWTIVAMVLVLLLHHTVFGRARLDRPLSGRRVPRWSWLNRLLHWSTAVTFIALTVTGLSLLIGRELLIPVLGKAGFAAWAQASIQVHNVIGPLFSVCIVLMIVCWVHANIPNRVDLAWLKAGGGMFSKGSHHHPSAGRFNAGEKLWFWLLVIGGGAVVASGIVLVGPTYAHLLPVAVTDLFAGLGRAQMQQANVVHAVVATLWAAVALGHVYIGTAGTEGAFEGMSTGYVSEEWARQHHDLWHEEMASRGRILPAAERPPVPASRAEPAN